MHRVTAVYRVQQTVCFELGDEFLLTAQVAEEHGHVELLLVRLTELPDRFSPSQRRPCIWQLLLIGRRFRGYSHSARTGNVVLSFGRYGIYMICSQGTGEIVSQADTPESRDLPEDLYLSIDQQLAQYRGLATTAIH